jgi:Do/DeqQ family serine protease
MKKRILAAGGAALFLVALGASLTLLTARGNFLDETDRPSPLKGEQRRSVTELQKTYHNIYRQYRDSVVYISTTKTVKVRQNPLLKDPFFREFFGIPEGEIPKERERQGLGTGFILSSNGYIVTNYHVIADMDSVKVKIGDKEYDARVIGSDRLTDIALIKVEGDTAFKPVHFGDSDNVTIGDIVVAIGNPFGLDRTYTSGIVSAIARSEIDQVGVPHIQTDASINPGNSGGPLINIQGEVIGVNRMIYSRTGGNLGIGFAIPINTVKDTLIQLKEHGKVRRGYIGVYIAPLNEEAADKLGLSEPEGALIGRVQDGGPAEKAGIRKGDVILAIDGKKIRDYRDLLQTVSRKKIGSTSRFTVWRDGRKINLRVKIAERP